MAPERRRSLRSKCGRLCFLRNAIKQLCISCQLGTVTFILTVLQMNNASLYAGTAKCRSSRMLLNQNLELRHLAVPAYSDALFICRTVSMKVTVPSWQEIHNCLIAFRKKHNLPHFDLSDLRRSGAILHHKAGRSIASAQQRLQHKSPKVTQNYTSLSDRTTDHQSQIRKFQGIMVQEAQKFNSGEKAVTPKYTNSWSSAETLFGFGCKDPLAGIAEGSRPGVACPKFQLEG